MKLFSDLGALLTLVAFAGGCAHSAAPAEQSSRPLRPEPRAPLVEPPAPRPLTGENPFSGAKLYVDPDTSAAQGALRLRASDPASAGILERIARNPQGVWIGDWNHDVFRAVDHLVQRAEANRAVPVIIAYNLPYRDAAAAAEGVCHSCGGLSSEEAYRRWIRDFHAGIGGRRVVVVLEPDALAGIDVAGRCASRAAIPGGRRDPRAATAPRHGGVHRRGQSGVGPRRADGGDPETSRHRARARLLAQRLELRDHGKNASSTGASCRRSRGASTS